MEAVHRDEHGAVAERGGDLGGERRLAAAGRAGDAEEATVAARGQGSRAGEQRFQVVDHHRG
jgi:hypothetical protein